MHVLVPVLVVGCVDCISTRTHKAPQKPLAQGSPLWRVFQVLSMALMGWPRPEVLWMIAVLAGLQNGIVTNVGSVRTLTARMQRGPIRSQHSAISQ